MPDHWYAIGRPFAARPALILDASTTGQPHWPRQRELVRAARAALPECDWPDLFALGSPHPLAPADFERRADDWYASHVGRGRIIGPVFQALYARPEPPVAVLAAGRIFDLPDWRRLPIGDRTAYFRLGPSPVTDGLYAEDEPDAGHLAAHLHNPVVRVELAGDGVQPFYWDHPAWRWRDGCLLADTGDVGPALLGVRFDAGAVPRLVATRADGRSWSWGFDLAAPPAEEWCELPGVTEGRLRHALQWGSYPCPVCGGEHPAGQLECGGEPTFPGLTEAGGSFVIADISTWPARVRMHRSDGLRLAPQAVAIRTAPGWAEVCRGDGGAWEATGEPFAGWRRLEDETYALVL
jgi:hypothetical protein